MNESNSGAQGSVASSQSAHPRTSHHNPPVSTEYFYLVYCCPLTVVNPVDLVAGWYSPVPRTPLHRGWQNEGDPPDSTTGVH